MTIGFGRDVSVNTGSFRIRDTSYYVLLLDDFM